MKAYVVRFSKQQRTEHLLVMSTFLVLAITGFPQKFFEAGWSQAVVNGIGGLDRVRWLHRAAGVLFSVLAGFHIASAIFSVLLGKASFALIPNKKDFGDAITTLRYYLGLSNDQARFDRYDYRQKFEYWGLVLGGLLMVATGYVLLEPILVTKFFPGEVIPAAKVAHSNEGLMAFLVVITWHIYNAHLNPDVFPFDTAIFTGKVSRHRMEHEHPLELDHLDAAKGDKKGE
jgi:cytochrome b subunit of formate dehydrogenase